MRVLLAGGGTAGHTSPLLATADALRRLDPDRRGHLPRHAPRPREPRRPRGRLPARADPAGAAAAAPQRRPAQGARPGCAARCSETLAVLDRVRPDVVVGYGGYVSMPAYLAARRRKLPLVVHEQNALPGLANKVGARLAGRVAVSFPDTPLPQRGVRRPADPPDDLPRSTGPRCAPRPARSSASTPTGRRCWSPAAPRAPARLNQAVSGAARALADAGVQVLHVVGPNGEAAPEPTGVPYVVAELRRPDGPRLRRRRPGGLPRRRLQRDRGRRGRPAGGLRAAADRQRRAGPQRPSGRRRRRRAARRRRRPDLRVGGRAPSRPWPPTPTGSPAMGAAAAGADPARRRREAGPDRAGVRPDEGPGPRRDPARRPARPGPLRRHRRRRPVRHRPDHAGPRHRRSAAATATTPRRSARCATLGARVDLGHDAAHVGDVDTLVVSTAVREDNPEYLEAVRQGLRVLPRSAALAAVMAGRRVRRRRRHPRQDHDHLAAHGRPAGGRGRPDVRRRRRPRRRPAATPHEGAGDLFVAEADESDGAFLVYSPHAAIVTNVEADHLDNWGTEEAYRAAFAEFVDRIDPGGFLVCCVDDAGRRRPGGAGPGPRACAVVGVGESEGADVRATDLRFAGTTSTFTVHDGDRVLGEITLQIPGRHYVLDALAALAVGLRLGHAVRRAARAGSRASPAPGAGWSARARPAGVRVYDSYAHHPVEIAGDLQAARAVAGEGRLVVAFQPHLVSRTRIFGTAMGEALGAADEVVVLDVYLAREDADPEVTGALVADAVPLPPEAGRLRPRLRRRPRRARRPGPSGRPGADPRGRERHRAGSPGPGAARAVMPVPSSLQALPGRHRGPPGRRRGHAAHPQAVRPPAVGPPLAGLEARRRRAAPPGAGGGGRLGGVLLLVAGRPGRRGRRRLDAECRRGALGGRA